MNDDGFYVIRKLKTTIRRLEWTFLNILMYFANGKTDRIQEFPDQRLMEDDSILYIFE